MPNSCRGRKNRGWSFRRITSPMVAVAACTLTSTSFFLGIGFSTSRSCKTSGGPDFVHTIAFIRFLLWLLDLNFFESLVFISLLAFLGLVFFFSSFFFLFSLCYFFIFILFFFFPLTFA